jgi:hypothetical protein
MLLEVSLEREKKGTGCYIDIKEEVVKITNRLC